MSRGRTSLFALVGVLVLGAAVGGSYYALRPPRPSLSYPAGQSLESVRGNCRQGNELIACRSGDGPRSFLTVRASGDERRNAEALFTELVRRGWTKDVVGRTAHDYATGGAAEDLQPLYCTSAQGCVGLFRFVTNGYVLAWFAPP